MLDLYYKQSKVESCVYADRLLNSKLPVNKIDKYYIGEPIKKKFASIN